MITEETIKERISVIEGDIEKITKDISDAERKKTESISLLMHSQVRNNNVSVF